jgi:hypothetical protein
MDKIKVINNFFSNEDIEYIKGITDQLLNDSGLIIEQPETLRPLLRFGRDLGEESKWNKDLSVLEDTPRNFFANLNDRVVNAVKSAFGDDEDVYLNQFWLARQSPGAEVIPHEDTDDGDNYHFAYSAVGYLNTLPDEDGTIFFDDLDFSHWPQAGDLVVFYSQGTGMHRVPPIKDYRYTIPMWLTKDPEFKLGL